MKHFKLNEKILRRMNDEVTFFIVKQNDVQQPTCRNCAEYVGCSKSTVHVDLTQRFKYFITFVPYLFNNSVQDNGVNKFDINMFLNLNGSLSKPSKTKSPIKMENIHMLTKENFDIVRKILDTNKKECTIRGGIATHRNYMLKRIHNLTLSKRKDDKICQ